MELATLHLDTYKVVKLLQEKGYTESEAEGFIQAIQEITLTGVATKQDISDLKEDINDLKEATKQDLQDLEARLDTKVSILENKISKALSDSVKFQLIQTLAIIGVMVALFQFFAA